jgi:hypothetical protein
MALPGNRMGNRTSTISNQLYNGTGPIQLPFHAILQTGTHGRFRTELLSPSPQGDIQYVCVYVFLQLSFVCRWRKISVTTSAGRSETNAESLQQACETPSVSMIELLAIHLWGDACYALEGSCEVRHIAIPHTIPNISHSHAGVL